MTPSDIKYRQAQTESDELFICTVWVIRYGPQSVASPSDERRPIFRVIFIVIPVCLPEHPVCTRISSPVQNFFHRIKHRFENTHTPLLASSLPRLWLIHRHNSSGLLATGHGIKCCLASLLTMNRAASRAYGHAFPRTIARLGGRICFQFQRARGQTVANSILMSLFLSFFLYVRTCIFLLVSTHCRQRWHRIGR